MRILLDQDQVLAQWVERVLQYFNEDFGTKLTVEDIKTWDMTENLGPRSEAAIRSYMRYPELYRDLDPVEGAIDGVKSLIDDGHDVVIVTAVPRSAGISYHGKLEWLRRNMPYFDLANLISCHRKDLIRGDMLLDDGPHNIEPFMKVGHAVVFDRPWNKDVEGHARVHSWKEFLEYVKLLESNQTFIRKG